MTNAGAVTNRSDAAAESDFDYDDVERDSPVVAVYLIGETLFAELFVGSCGSDFA